MLVAGFKGNSTLLSLKLGGNPLQPDEVEKITSSIQRNIKKLDFGDTWVNKTFLPVIIFIFLPQTIIKINIL